MVSNSLKRINKEFNTTIIMVSHHVDFIEEVGTRAIMMENGEIVREGNTITICEDFVNRCQALYLKKKEDSGAVLN
jgi:methyl coenzyme M reductase system subunit A2